MKQTTDVSESETCESQSNCIVKMVLTSKERDQCVPVQMEFATLTSLNIWKRQNEEIWKAGFPLSLKIVMTIQLLAAISVPQELIAMK